MFMNRWDVDEAANQFRDHAVLGPATRTLSSLRDAVDDNSDGWAYWQVPQRAAQKLIALIQQGDRWERGVYDRVRPDEPTAAQLKAALIPIKSFRTKFKDKFTFEIFETSAPGQLYAVTFERTEQITVVLDAKSPEDAEQRYLTDGKRVACMSVALKIHAVGPCTESGLLVRR